MQLHESVVKKKKSGHVAEESHILYAYECSNSIEFRQYVLKHEFMEIKIERLKISPLPSDVCLQEYCTESLQRVLKSFPAAVWRRESLPVSFHSSAGKTDSLLLGFRIVIKLGDLWVTTLKTE